MKLALSGFLFERQYRSCDLSFADFVALAKDSGFDAVELRRTQISADTPLETAEHMGRILDEQKIFPSCMEARGLPDEQPACDDFFKALVHRAGLLGCGLIKLANNRISGQSAWRHWAADYAAQNGVILGINNHVGTEFETVEGTIRAFKQVDHPNFRLLYDCAHLRSTGSDYVGAVSQLKAWIQNVLIQGSRPIEPGEDAGDRSYVSTTIDAPRSQNWQGVFAALHQIDYDGLITVIEHTEDPDLRKKICSTYPQLIRRWWDQTGNQQNCARPS